MQKRQHKQNIWCVILSGLKLKNKDNRYVNIQPNIKNTSKHSNVKVQLYMRNKQLSCFMLHVYLFRMFCFVVLQRCLLSFKFSRARWYLTCAQNKANSNLNKGSLHWSHDPVTKNIPQNLLSVSFTYHIKQNISSSTYLQQI